MRAKNAVRQKKLSSQLLTNSLNILQIIITVAILLASMMAQPQVLIWFENVISRSVYVAGETRTNGAI